MLSGLSKGKNVFVLMDKKQSNVGCDINCVERRLCKLRILKLRSRVLRMGRTGDSLSMASTLACVDCCVLFGQVIEESPSCLITPQTRLAMQEQAIMLSKATGYRYEERSTNRARLCSRYS